MLRVIGNKVAVEIIPQPSTSGLLVLPQSRRPEYWQKAKVVAIGDGVHRDDRDVLEKAEFVWVSDYVGARLQDEKLRVYLLEDVMLAEFPPTQLTATTRKEQSDDVTDCNKSKA